jgi:hypothetical protein
MAYDWTDLSLSLSYADYNATVPTATGKRPSR